MEPKGRLEGVSVGAKKTKHMINFHLCVGFKLNAFKNATMDCASLCGNIRVAATEAAAARLNQVNGSQMGF